MFELIFLGQFSPCFIQHFNLTGPLVMIRLKMHEESSTRGKAEDDVKEGAVPAYLLDRENTSRAKVFTLIIPKGLHSVSLNDWE